MRSATPSRRLLPAAAVRLAAALLVVASLASCADGAASEAPSVEGTWGDTGDSSAPSLEFAPGGRVSGTDGCNDMMGTWAQDGTTVTLDEMTSTLIGCPDVETWLSDAATAELDGETLELFASDATPIGTLQR